MKKMDNRGFSLVELLVAIVIMAIVVFPLLNSFTMSAKTAARSQNVGEATITANNLAEQVEIRTLSRMLADGFGTGSTVEYITESGAHTAVKPAGDKFVTWMEGVGTRDFNVRITFDPTTDFADINKVPVSTYAGMDGVYAQARDEYSDPDLIAHNRFMMYMELNHPYWNHKPEEEEKEEAAPGAPEEEEKQPAYEVGRNITITLREDVSGILKCSVEHEYTFFCTYEKPVENAAGGTKKEIVKVNWSTSQPEEIPMLPEEVFPNGFDISTGVYPNIYIMYYPMEYYAVMCGERNDVKIGLMDETIRIVNKRSDSNTYYPVTFFLVKQVEDRLVSNTYLYKTTIVQAIPDLDVTVKGAPVYSNAKETFGLMNTNTEYFVDHGKFLRSEPLSFAGRKELEPGKTYGSEDSLVVKAEKNRLYEVTIEIFETGADETDTPVYTMTTTKLQ